MVDQSIARVHHTLVQGLLERVERQVGAKRVRHPPAHDAPGIGVDDERDVNEPRPSRDVREVREPQGVRARGPEHPVDAVRRSPREFVQTEKQEQEIAEACRRLVKNSIICWNYLYLSQKIADCDNHDREVLLEAVTNGSVISWRHVNLLGEYDFSDEKLEDTVGIRSPKLAA